MSDSQPIGQCNVCGLVINDDDVTLYDLNGSLKCETCFKDQCAECECELDNNSWDEHESCDAWGSPLCLACNTTYWEKKN